MADFSTYEGRLQTFQGWPHNYQHATPETLAEAGFYLLPSPFGDRDRVICYSCRQSLVQWDPTDIPWEEHRRHSPRCPLVITHFSAPVVRPDTPPPVATGGATAAQQSPNQPNLGLLDFPLDEHIQKIWDSIPMDCTILCPSTTPGEPEAQIQCHMAVIGYFSSFVSEAAKSSQQSGTSVVIRAPAGVTEQDLRVLIAAMYSGNFKVEGKLLARLLVTSQALQCDIFTKTISPKVWTNSDAVDELMSSCLSPETSGEKSPSLPQDFFENCESFYTKDLQTLQGLANANVPIDLIREVLSCPKLPCCELEVFKIASEWSNHAAKARAIESGSEAGSEKDPDHTRALACSLFESLGDIIDWKKIGFVDLKNVVYPAQVMSDERMLEVFKTCMEIESDLDPRDPDTQPKAAPYKIVPQQVYKFGKWCVFFETNFDFFMWFVGDDGNFQKGAEIIAGSNGWWRYCTPSQSFVVWGSGSTSPQAMGRRPWESHPGSYIGAPRFLPASIIESSINRSLVQFEQVGQDLRIIWKREAANQSIKIGPKDSTLRYSQGVQEENL